MIQRPGNAHEIKEFGFSQGDKSITCLIWHTLDSAMNGSYSRKCVHHEPILVQPFTLDVPVAIASDCSTYAAITSDETLIDLVMCPTSRLTNHAGLWNGTLTDLPPWSAPNPARGLTLVGRSGIIS